MNETEYRLRLKGEIDIEAVIAASSKSDAIDKADAVQEAINNQITIDCGNIANVKEIITNEIALKFVCAEIAD
ncbi:hypothetical protein [uncultured Veillonella sp.]|jgi:hypothetical protein|uniref:hypothetical protein n=1 Tax=uncultured Veillonella sp. TaxID=159268 RepID=UPI002633EFEB|nr:hypothetical protein [uncultured Veillonella sp.]